jgi:hypothetical protein
MRDVMNTAPVTVNDSRILLQAAKLAGPGAEVRARLPRHSRRCSTRFAADDPL